MKVRRDDDDAFFGGVHQPDEQLHVVLEVEPGARRHDLAVEVARPCRCADHIVVVGQELTRFGKPVATEDRVHTRHHGALDTRHQVDPVQPAAQVGRQVVGVVGEVLRAGERHQAVDHQQLAVVAHVGRVYLPLNGCTGSIRCQLAPVSSNLARVAR
jgi:hypothetical protein